MRLDDAVWTSDGGSHLLLLVRGCFRTSAGVSGAAVVLLRTLCVALRAAFLTAAKNSLLPHVSPLTRMQPLAALIFLCYCVLAIDVFSTARYQFASSLEFLN